MSDTNPYPCTLMRIDPFDLILNTRCAMLTRHHPPLWERDSRLVRELENVEGSNSYYFITASGKKVVRLVFEDDESICVNQAEIFVLPPKNKGESKIAKNDPISRSDQLGKFKSICPVNVTWSEIEPIGYLPQMIVANCGGYRLHSPQLSSKIQIKFFGYEFDESKLDLSVCEQSSFDKERLRTYLDVDRLRSEVEQVSFQKFTPKARR